MNRPSKARALVMAALAAMSGAQVTMPAPAGTPGVVQQQSNDKSQAPTQVQQAVNDLAFLDDYGVPPRGNLRGCPWPGRRAACARRSAGAVRRMR